MRRGRWVRRAGAAWVAVALAAITAAPGRSTEHALVTLYVGDRTERSYPAIAGTKADQFEVIAKVAPAACAGSAACDTVRVRAETPPGFSLRTAETHLRVTLSWDATTLPDGTPGNLLDLKAWRIMPDGTEVAVASGRRVGTSEVLRIIAHVEGHDSGELAFTIDNQSGVNQGYRLAFEYTQEVFDSGAPSPHDPPANPSGRGSETTMPFAARPSVVVGPEPFPTGTLPAHDPALVSGFAGGDLAFEEHGVDALDVALVDGVTTAAAANRRPPGPVSTAAAFFWFGIVPGVTLASGLGVAYGRRGRWRRAG